MIANLFDLMGASRRDLVKEIEKLVGDSAYREEWQPDSSWLQDAHRWII